MKTKKALRGEAKETKENNYPFSLQGEFENEIPKGGSVFFHYWPMAVKEGKVMSKYVRDVVDLVDVNQPIKIVKWRYNKPEKKPIYKVVYEGDAFGPIPRFAMKLRVLWIRPEVKSDGDLCIGIYAEKPR